jgi:hypothetical protein
MPNSGSTTSSSRAWRLVAVVIVYSFGCQGVAWALPRSIVAN